METTGIRLFGKNITCYDGPKITNIPVSTMVAGEEFSDYSNVEHLEEDQVKERNQEHGNHNHSAQDAEQDSKKTETDDATNSQLKKPDTILPCPRCKSMDTKFCYYNNYNVKQPRHFCKSCQRYWTAGGTMRTMPVGAGRRRNKNPLSHCRFESNISQEAFQASQINVSNGIPPKFLSFGLDFAHVNKENGDDSSSGSTVTTSNSVTEKTQDRNVFHPQVPCILPCVSWSYNPCIGIQLESYCQTIHGSGNRIT